MDKVSDDKLLQIRLLQKEWGEIAKRKYLDIGQTTKAAVISEYLDRFDVANKAFGFILSNLNDISVDKSCSDIVGAIIEIYKNLFGEELGKYSSYQDYEDNYIFEFFSENDIKMEQLLELEDYIRQHIKQKLYFRLESDKVFSLTVPDVENEDEEDV